jgi:hypothetical protein
MARFENTSDAAQAELDQILFHARTDPSIRHMASIDERNEIAAFASCAFRPAVHPSS